MCQGARVQFQVQLYKVQLRHGKNQQNSSKKFELPKYYAVFKFQQARFSLEESQIQTIAFLAAAFFGHVWNKIDDIGKYYS